MLDYFRTEYEAMHFESEAEKNIVNDICKEEFCHKTLKSLKKKVGEKNSFETQKLT